MDKDTLTEEQKQILTKLSSRLQILIMEFAVDNREDMHKLGNLYASTINVGVQALMNAISNIHLQIDMQEGSLDADNEEANLKRHDVYCGNILKYIRDQAAIMKMAHDEGDLTHTIYS